MRLVGSRWALLTIFVVVEAVCVPALDAGATFTGFTVLNTLACAVLLLTLRGPARSTAWVWAILILFLTSYFLKMAWFATKVDEPFYLARNYPELRWLTADRLVEAYPWVTLGFVTFCLTAALILRRGLVVHPLARPHERVLRPRMALHLALAVGLAYAPLSLLQLSLKYGLLGAANPQLPFGLGPALTLFRQTLVPALLLLSVFVLDRVGSRRALVPTVLLFGSAIVDSLISTSRSSLLLASAPLFLLWLITDKLTRPRKTALLSAALAVVILFPVISSLRGTRLDGGASTQGGFSIGQIADASSLVLNRITAGGVEGVWYAVDFVEDPSVDRVLMFLPPRAMTKYFTEEVVGVTRPDDFRAVGTVGGFMIIGGGVGLVVFSALSLLVTYRLWLRLQRFHSGAPTLALMTTAMAVYTTAGGFEYLSLVKVLLAAVLLEFLYRKLLTEAPPPPAMDLRPRSRSAGSRSVAIVGSPS